MSLTRRVVPEPRPPPESLQQMNAEVALSLQHRAAPHPSSSITTVKYRADSEYVVRIAEKRPDPLDPSRFRNRKPMPLQQPDPAPILAAPMPRLSPAEEQSWQVPACVSNWKNPEGFVIPMDKRVGADARRFDQPALSDRFATFSKALDAGSAAIRDSLRQRAAVERQLAQRRREQEEGRLLDEARRLHDERVRVDRRKTDGERRIDEILADHRAERERIKRRNRDASAIVAPGMPLVARNEAGIDAGYGPEDSYQVYDAPGRPDRRAYVPFGGGRAPTGKRVDDATEVTFTVGEKQAPERRAGAFYPADDMADGESD
jgi:SNW domain-containing protein 1